MRLCWKTFELRYLRASTNVLFLAAFALSLPTANASDEPYLPGYGDESTSFSAYDSVSQAFGPGYNPNFGENSTRYSGTAFRLTDDINANGTPGAAVVIDSAGQLTTNTDFGDIYEFNVGPNQVNVDDIVGSSALDIVNVVWLTGDDRGRGTSSTRTGLPAHLMDSVDVGAGYGATSLTRRTAIRDLNEDIPGQYSWTNSTYANRSDGVGLIYGMRIFELQERLTVDAFGGILDRMQIMVDTSNELFGPQTGVVIAKRRGPWTAKLQGTVYACYNSGYVDQDGAFGRGRIPGAINRPTFATSAPTVFNHAENHNEISPGGEVRAEVQLQVTASVSLKAVWSHAVFDNTLLTDNRILWSLPDMGLRDPGRQSWDFDNLFCGVQMVR